MRKKLTFRELQEKWNPIYINQPKPEPIRLYDYSIALRYCIEVLLLHGQRL